MSLRSDVPSWIFLSLIALLGLFWGMACWTFWRQYYPEKFGFGALPLFWSLMLFLNPPVASFLLALMFRSRRSGNHERGLRILGVMIVLAVWIGCAVFWWA